MSGLFYLLAALVLLGTAIVASVKECPVAATLAALGSSVCGIAFAMAVQP